MCVCVCVCLVFIDWAACACVCVCALSSLIGPHVRVCMCVCVYMCVHVCMCVCPYRVRVCCMKNLDASDYFHPGLKLFHTAHLPIWWKILTLHNFAFTCLLTSPYQSNLYKCLLFFFKVNGINVLKLHASTPYIYGRMLLDMLFTRSELKDSLILPSAKRRRCLIKKKWIY